jgi:hypothetical protein
MFRYGKITNKKYCGLTELSDKGARIDLNKFVEASVFQVKGREGIALCPQ